MSPIVIIVFAPVVLIGLVFYSLLFGAALAGVWEAVEERANGRVSVSGSVRPRTRMQSRSPDSRTSPTPDRGREIGAAA
jgi:hypothetical protein